MKTVIVLMLVLWAGMGWAATKESMNLAGITATSCSVTVDWTTWREIPCASLNTVCEQKMQAAMEAMEERVTKNEESEWTVIGDGTGTITWDHMQFYDDMTPKHHYTPDTRTAEERLEDEFKALKQRKVELAEQRVREAKEKIEREERKAKKLKADQLWTEAKQCWKRQ